MGKKPSRAHNSRKRKNRISVIYAVILAVFAVFEIIIIKDHLNNDHESIVADNTVREYKISDGEKNFLILVNGSNPIPENYETELTELSNGQSVDSRIYPDLQKMFDDMREQGIYPVVGEGYRTAEAQQKAMDDKIEAFMHDGCSKKIAERLAAEQVAVVGTSEHQLGLAVDINADKTKSDNEEVYAWLAENAYKYGFILRYPANKVKITGYDYEPWHYRYVGKENAEIIHSEGICLEEYVENYEE